jgi:hypothetical protein
MQMPVGDLDSQINFSIRDTVCRAHLGPCNTVGTDRLVQLGNTILLCRICHGRQSLRHIHSRAASSSCRHHSNGHDNDHHSMGWDHKGNNRRHTARRLRQASPKAPLRPPITIRASSSSPPGANLNANTLEDVPLRGTYGLRQALDTSNPATALSTSSSANLGFRAQFCAAMRRASRS